MYKVIKQIEISAMHKLYLDYQSPCVNFHGHNWMITIQVSGQKLNKYGMLLDFKRIKDLIKDKIDHDDLNEVFKFNPTAENIATWVRDEVDAYISRNMLDYKIDDEDISLPKCSKVIIQESEKNIAEWSL